MRPSKVARLSGQAPRVRFAPDSLSTAPLPADGAEAYETSTPFLYTRGPATGSQVTATCCQVLSVMVPVAAIAPPEAVARLTLISRRPAPLAPLSRKRLEPSAPVPP